MWSGPNCGVFSGLTAVKDAAGTLNLATYTYGPLDRLRMFGYGWRACETVALIDVDPVFDEVIPTLLIAS